MILARLPEPFSDPDWLFEVKHDGLRALCYVNKRSAKLVSRRGHAQFKRTPVPSGRALLLCFRSALARRGRLAGTAQSPSQAHSETSIPLLYLDHIQGRCEDLFRLTCQRDLERIVAKWKRGAYVAGERTAE